MSHNGLPSRFFFRQLQTQTRSVGQLHSETVGDLKLNQAGVKSTVLVNSGLKPVQLAKQDEAASRCSCRSLAAKEYHVMVKLNLSSYTVP